MSIADRLADRLAHKVTAAGLDRIDLSVQDFAVAREGNSARVMIGFDPKLKFPDTQAIARFITSRFEGKLETKTATAQVHPDIHAVSVIVTSMTSTRPLDDLRMTIAGTDKKQFIPVIANTLYMDQTIGANWEIKTNPESGTKYLAQVRTEDIAGMLAKARVRHATASFGKGHTAVAFILPESGDYVEFFADNGLRQGEVSKTKGEEVTIVDEGGATYLVEQSNVTRMLRKNTKKTKQQEDAMIEALVPTMGNRKLAEELVRGTKH